MRSLLVLCCALLAPLALGADPSAEATTAVSARYGLEHLPCSSFSWNADRNVVRVPISLAGQPYLYQLDTGADVVIPYGTKDHPGWVAKHEGVRIPDVAFAGFTFPSVVGYRFTQFPDPVNPATDLGGSVGLDLLVGNTFVIDFPQQRVCLFRKADLPDALDRAASWTPAEVRHGKLFVPLHVNGRLLPGIFYDTGSSPTTLDVDLALWRQLTNRTVAQATSHGSGLSWGKARTGISAAATGSLTLGTLTLPHPEVGTQPTKPHFYQDQDQAQGLLGNEPFLHSIVILDLGSHAQFGLVTDP